MRYIIYLIVFFLYLFAPVFNKFGAGADLILFTSVVICAFSTAFPKPWLPYYLTKFLVLLPLFIVVTFIASFYDGVSFIDLMRIILRPMRMFFTLIAGYTIVRMMHYTYSKKFYFKVLEFVYLSIGIHAVIMILQFINPTFKDFIYSYTTTGDFRSSFDYHFRMGGLSGGTGGAVLSVVQSIGIILLPFILKGRPLFLKIIFILIGLLIFGSILVCGRSGIWTIILFLPIAFILKDFKLKVSSILRIFSTIIGVIVIMSIFISFIGELNNESPIFLAINRTLDTFLKFNETGDFNDHTAEVLKSHIVFPVDILTYIIGDTEHIINTQFSRTLDSDIGYIRNLWSFGLIGMIVYVTPVLRVLVCSFNDRSKFMSARVVILLSLVTLFFHLKESFLYTRMLFSIYCVFMGVYFIEKKIVSD